MMQGWDLKRSREGFWSFCAKCNGYTYTPKETREHQMQVHGRSEEDVLNSWPDDKKEEPCLTSQAS